MTEAQAKAEGLGYCEHYNRYTRRSMYKVYTYEGEFTYSRRAVNYLVETGDLVQYCGEYYDESEMEANDLVRVQDTGRIEHVDDACEHSNGLFYSYEEDNERNYLRSYHDNEKVYFHRFTTPARVPFFIGYEIEKEDREVKKSVKIDVFEDAHPKWRKERDGSLNEHGYELISPAFELKPEEIQRYIESRPRLVEHINAKFTTNCGGHINVSEEGKSGEELFDDIKGYTPLLHALYHGRAERVSPTSGSMYCKAKSNSRLKADRSKFQSINIHDDRVELRIVSAVRNVNNLMWRTRLIEYMMNNQTPEILNVYKDVRNPFSGLHSILREVYNTDEQFNALSKRLIDASITYENFDPRNAQ